MNKNITQAVETAYQQADAKRWESIQELVFSGYVDAIVEFFNKPIIKTNALSPIEAYKAGGKIAHKAIDYLGMTFAIVIDSDYRYCAKDSFDDGEYEIDIDQFLFFVDGCSVFNTTISRSSFKSADGKVQNYDQEISMNIDDFVVARPGIWGNILIEALAHLELSIEETEQNAEILRKAQYLRNIDQDFSELH